MDTRVKNELLYILTVLNMVADGRATDYDGAPIAVQASIAVRGLENLLYQEEDETDEDERPREFEVTEFERVLRTRTFTVTAHSDSEAIEIAEYMIDGKGDYEDEVLESYFDVEEL